MEKIENIDELHLMLLGIAREFHSICMSHHIPYYMLGGTMLGAVRHKGFIPWDDDMDFGIPRPYYLSALSLLRNQLNPRYLVTTAKDGVGIVGDFAKIEDSYTVIHEQRCGSERDFGIFIDIFPLDYTNYNYGRFSRNVTIARLLKAQRMVVEKKGGLESLFYRVISNLFGEYVFVDSIKKLVRDKGDFLANYSGSWGHRETVPKAIMGKPILYDFEDAQLFGVERPDEYLTNLYGDYMKLPEENERHVHISDIYIK